MRSVWPFYDARKQAPSNSPIRYVDAGTANLQKLSRVRVAPWRSSRKYLLGRQSGSDASNRRDVIAIGTDDQRSVKNVVDRILEGQGEMDVGFLFFVLFPSRFALPTTRAFFAEPRHMALDVR